MKVLLRLFLQLQLQLVLLMVLEVVGALLVLELLLV